MCKKSAMADTVRKNRYIYRLYKLEEIWDKYDVYDKN